MIKYIINNEVIFLPREKEIISLKDGRKSTILASSALCLEVLLNQQGNIVSHTELLIAGWGENAKQSVTNAAYYQSFVNLRNILRKLGCQENILVTIRGKGIRLNPYVTVTKYDDNQPKHIECTISEVGGIDSNQLESNPDRSGELNALRVYVNTSDMPEQQGGESVDYAKRKYRFYLTVVVVLIFSLIYLLVHNYFNEKYVIKGFSYLQGSPPCYFLNNRNIDNGFVIDFAINKNLICKKGIRYYISYFSTSPRLTVFTCDKDTSLKCNSITYIVEKNEKN